MIIADFSKESLVDEHEIQNLRKSAVYEVDLKERWPFSGKEAEWNRKEPLQEHISVWENLLYNENLFFSFN